MKRKLDGGITVFLTGILLVMVTVTLMLVNVTKWIAVRTESVAVSNMAVDSVFAEYNRELLNQYDLFFVDMSYGSAAPSLSNLRGHLTEYLDKNLNMEEDVALWQYRDFLGIKVEDIKMTQMSLATDDMGRDLRFQAADYMRDKLGLNLLEDIQRQFTTFSTSDMFGEDPRGKYDELMAQYDEKWREKKDLGDGNLAMEEVDNPLDGIGPSMFSDLLYWLVDDISTLSDGRVNLDAYASHRRLSEGTGAARESDLSLIDNILFNEYLMDKCGCYRKPATKGELSYELEYLLQGKSTDKDNLMGVAFELVNLRWAMNLAHIYTSGSKKGEAQLMAAGIALVIGMPELEESISNILLLSWAYAESVVDVRRLFNGHGVPFIKTEQDWVLSLEGLFHIQESMHSEKGSDRDPKYETYLRMLLLMENANTKTQRLMDLIEMHLRKTPGNAHFRMDGCLDGLESEIHFRGGNGESVVVTKKYTYQNR